MKMLVTGSARFIAGYLVDELLNAGHEVGGIDDYSKHGRVEKSYQNHPRYIRSSVPYPGDNISSP